MRPCFGSLLKTYAPLGLEQQRVDIEQDGADECLALCGPSGMAGATHQGLSSAQISVAIRIEI